MCSMASFLSCVKFDDVVWFENLSVPLLEVGSNVELEPRVQMGMANL